MFGLGKKKDDLGLDKDMDFGKDDLNLGLDDPLSSPGQMPGGMPQHQPPPQEFPDLGAEQPSSFMQHDSQRPVYQEIGPAHEGPPQQMDPQRDFQLISAKLDAIKAGLDSINQRVLKIEKFVDIELQKEARKKVW